MNKKKILSDRAYINILCYLLIWIVFQDFFISIFYNVTDSKMLSKLLLYSKDFVMALLFIVAYFNIVTNSQKLRKYKSYIIVITIYLSIIVMYGLKSLIFSNIGIIDLLAAARGIVLLPVFIVIGLGIEDKKRMKDFIINKFFPLLVVIMVIGIIDYLFISKEFWKDVIGIGRYTEHIKGQFDRMVDGLPGNFYGDYGKGFFSQKRLVSVWAVPLTAAYIGSIPLVYYLLSIKKLSKAYMKEIVFVAILFFSIVLTHTRTMILLDVGFIVLYLLYRNRHLGYKLFAPVAALGGVGVIVFWDKIMAILYDGSTIGHINAIVTSITEIGILGNGIGTFGVWGGVSTENSYLTIAGQLGLIGLIIYLMIWYIPTIKMLKSNSYKQLSPLKGAIVVLTVLFVISGLVSEQILAFTTIMPYYLLLGICCSSER